MVVNKFAWSQKPEAYFPNVYSVWKVLCQLGSSKWKLNLGPESSRAALVTGTPSPVSTLWPHGGGALAQAGSPTLHHTVRIWEDITGGVTQSISKSITHRHRVKTSNSYGTVSYKMMTNWTAWLQWNQSFLSYEE